MTPRLNAFAAAPALMKSWLEFSQGLKHAGLEESLMALVVTRASQINGCAFCLDMHTADARQTRGNGAASLPARRLARFSALQRPRTRGAGLDRSPDLVARHPRPRRRL